MRAYTSGSWRRARLGSRETRQGSVPGQGDQSLEPNELLYLAALGRGALVVPEDRGSEDAILGVEADQAVHLAREAHAERSYAQTRKRLLARVQPVLRILLRPSGAWHRERIRLLCGGDDLASGVIAIALTPVADVEADERAHSAPSAAYTSSYARTASLRICASRKAGSSIRVATESMNRQCSTLRLTAATASSVYG